MAEYLSPGVYVEEFDSSVKAVVGVSTSTAGFLGFAACGPTAGKPVLITSVSQYYTVFGGYLDASVKYRHLSYGVEQFFANGGNRCYVMRVTGTQEKYDKLMDGEYAEIFIGKDNGPGKSSGLAAFIEVADVSIMAIPGVSIPEVQSALIAHCERMRNRFAILDMPADAQKTDELSQHCSCFDSSYAAIYHPWLQYFDRGTTQNAYFPPSASMAGIFARVDNHQGVFKAPGNEVVTGCTGLSVSYNEAEQRTVSSSGVNLIRALPGQGIRVWGARTLASESVWKYIHIRRLLLFIEESIRTNTSWTVYEQNDASLWMSVEGGIEIFLTTLWHDGALAGSSSDEAFFINIGNSTMSQEDIVNGRLIFDVGVAPVRPAEFISFRIIQQMPL